MIKVIIPASGVGARMGASVPKQFLELGGQPILKRTIAAFQNMDIVNEIIVTVPGEYIQTIADYGFSKVLHVLDGGLCQTRAASVKLALGALSTNTDIVLIHDAVRPFVTQELVQAVIDAVKIHGAAVACAPVTDTIKKAESSQITETVDRNQLWSAQTPQGFTYNLIMHAYHQAEKDGVLHQVTDDSMLVERLGLPVSVVPSSRANIKITTAEDLIFAEAFITHSIGTAHQGNFNPERLSPIRAGAFPAGGSDSECRVNSLDELAPTRKVTIFTDGACSGNPGPGGYGVVMQHGEHRKELSGGEPQTTNNRMEIMGVIMGLETLKQPCEVALYSDSRYVVDAIEKGWVTRWQQNNWMRNKKDPALNVDLWQRLLPLLDTHKVTFHWVKGHAGHPENERCDELAREAIVEIS